MPFFAPKMFKGVTYSDVAMVVAAQSGLRTFVG